MTKQDRFSSYPSRVLSWAEGRQTKYVLRDRYFAEHGHPGQGAPGAMFVLDEGRIAVYQGEPPAQSKGWLSPVYALEDGVALAVPTGEVFLQVAEGARVESLRQAIHQAGYRIREVLPYAPHAAWLTAQSAAEALRNLPVLGSIPGVRGVEPQMLMPRQAR